MYVVYIGETKYSEPVSFSEAMRLIEELKRVGYTNVTWKPYENTAS